MGKSLDSTITVRRVQLFPFFWHNIDVLMLCFVKNNVLHVLLAYDMRRQYENFFYFFFNFYINMNKRLNAFIIVDSDAKTWLIPRGNYSRVELMPTYFYNTSVACKHLDNWIHITKHRHKNLIVYSINCLIDLINRRLKR